MLDLDRFGLTMLPAQAMNEGSLTVMLIHLEVITVSTLKMLELGAELQLVSICGYHYHYYVQYTEL